MNLTVDYLYCSISTKIRTTSWTIKSNKLIFVCNFDKHQRILVQFSLLDIKMNSTLMA